MIWQKYRSHRKHLLAREAEAASWTQKRQMYGVAMGGGKGGGNISPWYPPTMGFPPMTTMHHPFRPLHVWGHPTMDPHPHPHQTRMPMWPKQPLPSPTPWPHPPPPPDQSFWHSSHHRVSSHSTPFFFLIYAHITNLSLLYTLSFILDVVHLKDFHINTVRKSFNYLGKRKRNKI